MSDSKQVSKNPVSRGSSTSKSSFKVSAPSISLPKGGGAIRGIGEKFSSNPVTGTASFSVPIYTSPGRSGFGPKLSLSYDSGLGNGPFGFGWSLNLPSITRKTNKGIPKYEDDIESDVFILSGVEDLVPVLKKDERGEWIHDEKGILIIDEQERDGYVVRRYRPRVEGLFALIERWTRNSDGDIHWRSISKDNILTVYGRDERSRIADPTAGDKKNQRIFSWLICESYDDKGNAIVYEYAAENDDGIDLLQANERNRLRTANRYIKRIFYGNRQPDLLDINKPGFRKSHIEGQTNFNSAGWMFEIVFDYGGEDHYIKLPLISTLPDLEQHRFVRAAANLASGSYNTLSSSFVRPDPFSTYRAGFEVRTYRRCQRVLMFHRFADLGNQPYLVRSTEFDYSDFDYSRGGEGHTIDAKTELEYKGSTRFASFIQSVTQSGYIRDETRPVHVINGINYVTYLKKSLPPLEFEYSMVTIHEDVMDVDTQSLENLPSGLDGTRYQWIDLDGEGLSSILMEQDGTWYYKRNVSGLTVLGNNGKPSSATAQFAPVERLKNVPSPGNLGGGEQQLMDLSGDGQLDLVQFDGPLAGYFERTKDENWETFTRFTSVPNILWDDPNLKFIDLTGDGYADILVTQDRAHIWYPSLAERGFEEGKKVHQSLDEEDGPHLVFADGTQSVYLADMSGDGLTDLLRIRNGEICYWPNLGYGRFGAKVTMDKSPWLDSPDQFDQKRIRLVDLDGSGVTDILYLGHEGAAYLYFNQSGNRWSDPLTLTQFPRLDNLSEVAALDLFGSGTACLVWSSSLPSDTRQPMRYVDLMGGQKPHLLVSIKNNMGAETYLEYTPSTKFYLADKMAGKPWVTRLPFPVQVVERVKTYDRISRNHFTTRYTYHHGYFDGEEREFRGFGRVDQYDTEEFATFMRGSESGVEELPISGENIEASSHVPPVLTKTWFHTGVYLGRNHVSNFFDGHIDAFDRGEYFREPAWQDNDEEAKKHLLDDTLLPSDLTNEEEREACRVLKGSMLRQEVYAIDGTDRAEYPYTVTEQNFGVRMLQPQRDSKNCHAVFFAHPKETITYHYERKPADPRISHALTLEIDDFGNILKQVAVGYGRRKPDPDLPEVADQGKQTKTLISYTENSYTNTYPDPRTNLAFEYVDSYRAPLPCETRIYELTGYAATGAVGRFQDNDFVQLVRPNTDDPIHLAHIFDSEINYEEQPTNGRQRRLIEQLRTLYRKNDLTDLCRLGELESLAIQGESYNLAFTPGLLAQVFQRNEQSLVVTDPNDPDNVLGSSEDGDHGGYIPNQQLKAEGKFPNIDPDNWWWIATGRVFYSANNNNNAAEELDYAVRHFFLPLRFRDPFGKNTTVSYDSSETDSERNYNLVLIETRDPLGNRVTVGERLPNGQIDPNKQGNDYRVLQPRLVTDPNRNRTEVAFDTLGVVVGTAAKGKGEDNAGDNLDGFEVDLTQAQVDEFYDNSDPHAHASGLLRGATTRIIYDAHYFSRTQKAHPDDPTKWLPTYASTLARETHVSDAVPPNGFRIQISFSYSDGFGREIQRKIQAEPGPLVKDGPVISPSWVGSGWTVFNNKDKPVRQYEPFFSQLSERRHQFEFGVQVGLSPILFYDPVQRVIATLHPNHTYEKVVFDPWRQIGYDVNDTVVPRGTQSGDPRTDPDVQGFVSKYFATLNDPAWQTWFEQRQSGASIEEEQAAATKAAAHSDTPLVTYFDTFGRPFLTITHNRYERNGTIIHETCAARVELDIEGNQLEVRDSGVQNDDIHGRVVMRYEYDMLGNLIHQLSMDSGDRWMLNDVSGNPIRAWDSHGHTYRIEYDPLRRPIRSLVTGASPDNPDRELLTERMIYGEQHHEGEQRNLLGRLYLHLDQVGMVMTESYDFKGNPLRDSRRLTKQYKQTVDWRTVDENHVAVPTSPSDKLNFTALKAALVPMLERDEDAFTSRSTYDALNRPIQIIFPHSNKPETKLKLIQQVYNEANLLERIDAWLDVNTEPSGLLDPSTATEQFIKGIDYNAKGQRELIEYGNGVTTTYAYDRFTFRLTHSQTLRGRDGSVEKLQDLFYIYDPIGNIFSIRDEAQQTIFFNGQTIKPDVEYTYDAIYRLIKAAGREHIGQPSQPHTTWDDKFRAGFAHPHDGQKMRKYLELYTYDQAGNILRLDHRIAETNRSLNWIGNWVRTYNYNEKSLIEQDRKSNRLTSTNVGSIEENYKHDLHGNIYHMPHLNNQTHADEANMHWNFKDQLNKVDLGGGGNAYYVYDATGQRIRKVHEHIGALVEERIYISNFEIYRKYPKNKPTDLILERETLHIVDGKQRVASVDIRIIDKSNDDQAFQKSIRYQCGNHLGSCCLELDEEAKIISYEEYYPYGGTSYQAVRSHIELPAKRYRYSGRERDEETGFYYYGKRYFPPWLGRWISADTVFEQANLYVFVRNNPSTRKETNGTISGLSEYISELESANEQLVQSAAQADTKVGAAGMGILAGLGRIGTGALRAINTTANAATMVLAETGLISEKDVTHAAGEIESSYESAKSVVRTVAQDPIGVASKIYETARDTTTAALSGDKEAIARLTATVTEIAANAPTGGKAAITGISKGTSLLKKGVKQGTKVVKEGVKSTANAVKEGTKRVGRAIGDRLAIRKAGAEVPQVTEVFIPRQKLEAMLELGESGQVRWVAGNEHLHAAFKAAEESASDLTATGRRAFNSFRKRFEGHVELEGPIHHFRYPITTYAGEAVSAENLYLTTSKQIQSQLGSAKAHTLLHRIFGDESVHPFRQMKWEGEARELQNMFNFLLPK